MFSKDDDLRCVVSNVKDVEGNQIKFVRALPLTSDALNLPPNMVQIDFFEYREDINSWNPELTIYRGRKANARDLFEFIVKNNVPAKLMPEVGELNSSMGPVCYVQDPKYGIVIYKRANKDDIVVPEVEDVEDLIIQLSDHVQKIKREISLVKNLKQMDKSNRLNKNN